MILVALGRGVQGEERLDMALWVLCLVSDIIPRSSRPSIAFVSWKMIEWGKAFTIVGCSYSLVCLWQVHRPIGSDWVENMYQCGKILYVWTCGCSDHSRSGWRGYRSKGSRLAGLTALLHLSETVPYPFDRLWKRNSLASQSTQATPHFTNIMPYY